MHLRRGGLTFLKRAQLHIFFLSFFLLLPSFFPTKAVSIFAPFFQHGVTVNVEYVSTGSGEGKRRIKGEVFNSS